MPVLDIKIIALIALRPLITRSFTKSSLTVSTSEHSIGLSRSFLQMKAENQNFRQMENLSRKLTSSIDNKFTIQTQIHQCGAVVMLTDVQAYCVTFLICLFQAALTAAVIYLKTTEAKLYT